MPRLFIVLVVLASCGGGDAKRKARRNPPSEETVRALPIVPGGLCNDASVCWEHPLPHGNGVLDMLARAVDDVWAVGEGGLIANWDGEAWRYESPQTFRSLYVIAELDQRLIAGGEGGVIVERRESGWEVTRDGTDTTSDVVGFHRDRELGLVAVSDRGHFVVPADEGWLLATEIEELSVVSALGSNAGTLYAAGNGRGWWLSEQAWQRLPCPYLSGAVRLIRLGDEEALFLSVQDAARIRGRQCRRVRLPEPEGFFQAHGATVSGGELVVVASRGEVWSHRSGRWISEDTGMTADLTTAAAVDDLLFVGGKSGTLARRSEGGWSIDAGGRELAHFHDVHGCSPSDLWVVGSGRSGGTVFRFDGSGWRSFDAPQSFQRVWCRAPNDVLFFTRQNRAFRWDGSNWSASYLPFSLRRSFQDLSVISRDEAWAISPYEVIRFDGQQWNAMGTFENHTLSRVWARAPDDVFVFTNGSEAGAIGRGPIQHWDGTRWETLPSPELVERGAVCGDAEIERVQHLGSSVAYLCDGSWKTIAFPGATATLELGEGNALMVDSRARLYHLVHGQIREVPTVRGSPRITQNKLNAIFAPGDGTIVAVGDGETILRLPVPR